MFRTGLNIKSVVFLVLKPSQLPIAQHVVFKSAACLVRPWPYFSLLFENSYGRQVAAVFTVGILYSNFLLLAFIVMISHQKHRLQFLSPSQVYPLICLSNLFLSYFSINFHLQLLHKFYFSFRLYIYLIVY